MMLGLPLQPYMQLTMAHMIYFGLDLLQIMQIWDLLLIGLIKMEPGCLVNGKTLLTVHHGVIGTFGKQENHLQVLKRVILIFGLFTVVNLRKEKVHLTSKKMMKNGMSSLITLNIQEAFGDGGLPVVQMYQ